MRARVLFTAAAMLLSIASTGAQEVRATQAIQVLRAPGGSSSVGVISDVVVPGNRVNPADVIQRLLSLDKDGDGRISRAEFPERMQALVQRADSDNDGVVTKDEVEKLVRLVASARPNPQLPPKKAATMADIVNDLRLPQPKHDLAMELAQRYREGVRNVNNSRELNLPELQRRMRELLDDEEYDNFVAAADRLKTNGRIVFQSGVRID